MGPGPLGVVVGAFRELFVLKASGDVAGGPEDTTQASSSSSLRKREPSAYPPCPAEQSASGSGFVKRRHTANDFRGFQLNSSLGVVESILGFPSLRTHRVFPDINDDKIHIKVTTLTICKCAAQRH